jgi:hypothetical protein
VLEILAFVDQRRERVFVIASRHMRLWGELMEVLEMGKLSVVLAE